eukprot:CAMPEP_0171620998 /NCGR_PEP_ID=MMETSP0990-20121206/16334_1 /TAXON_ID=483369 /ORGANISM="non described non described, Strain CCMP2098" /LENGTH=86 /DNA_ID=CAMNT_0012186417 /DNA_START=19 /DNA_END=279 /DNA_ORIENTATION=-
MQAARVFRTAALRAPNAPVRSFRTTAPVKVPNGLNADGTTKGHTINILIREACYGTVAGLAGAFLWYITVSKPVRDKINKYYEENP